MPDSGIKKVIIPKSSLPSVTESNQYLVRYRIVTEDRNRVSGWSPVFVLNAKQSQEVDADWSISGRVISLVWEDEETRPSYDVFTKFDGGDYFYHGSPTTHTYSIISQGTESFSFIIQISSISKTISQDLKIYESPEISLV